MTTLATQQDEVQPTETPNESATDISSQNAQVDTAQDRSPEPVKEADNETDDYEALAARFDEALKASTSDGEDTSKPKQPEATAAPEPVAPQPAKKSSSDPRFEAMYQKFEQDLVQANNRALDDAVTSIKDVAPAFKALSDRHVRGILEIEARDDPRFLNAYRNRDLDPKLWNDLVKAKGKQMQLKALPDEHATKGINAVRASVNDQSAPTSNSKYSPDQIADMDDRTFLHLASQGKI